MPPNAGMAVQGDAFMRAGWVMATRSLLYFFILIHQSAMAPRTNTIRFLHTSDWQLGMTRHFLSDEAAPRFSQDRIQAIGQLGEHARQYRVSFIVVAGDVFESNQLSRRTVARTIEALEALPVPITGAGLNRGGSRRGAVANQTSQCRPVRRNAGDFDAHGWRATCRRLPWTA